MYIDYLKFDHFEKLSNLIESVLYQIGLVANKKKEVASDWAALQEQNTREALGVAFVLMSVLYLIKRSGLLSVFFVKEAGEKQVDAKTSEQKSSPSPRSRSPSRKSKSPAKSS